VAVAVKAAGTPFGRPVVRIVRVPSGGTIVTGGAA
jgi:hypothetical protein